MAERRQGEGRSVTGRHHYTPRATAAERAMTAREMRTDETLARLLDRRRAMIEALKEYAVSADLALIGDFGRSTRDMMAIVYAETRDRCRGA